MGKIYHHKQQAAANSLQILDEPINLISRCLGRRLGLKPSPQMREVVLAIVNQFSQNRTDRSMSLHILKGNRELQVWLRPDHATIRWEENLGRRRNPRIEIIFFVGSDWYPTYIGRRPGKSSSHVDNHFWPEAITSSHEEQAGLADFAENWSTEIARFESGELIHLDVQEVF